MSEILYKFAANRIHLGNTGGILDSIAPIREDVSTLFNQLSSYYTGESGNQLRTLAQGIDIKLEGHLHDAKATPRQGTTQQEMMQKLDTRLSAQI